ncbi:MAG TPA: hypothetical protein VJ600_09410 [Holophagaceae bacterium]|nr:hypothetical protein [Holophagaceae bacterium]
MKTWHKVLFGLGSHWLFLYMPVFLVAMFTFVLANLQGAHEPSPLFIGGFLLLFAVHLISIFFMLFTIAIFIAYVVKHPQFSSNDRLLWALLLAFAGALAAPIFFWLHFRKHPIGEPFFGNPA